MKSMKLYCCRFGSTVSIGDEHGLARYRIVDELQSKNKHNTMLGSSEFHTLRGMKLRNKKKELRKAKCGNGSTHPNYTNI